MDTGVGAIYPYACFNGSVSSGLQRSSNTQKEFAGELSQGIYTSATPMDEAYISFKPKQG